MLRPDASLVATFRARSRLQGVPAVVRSFCGLAVASAAAVAVIAACGGSAAGAAAEPDCPAGEVLVVSCGGEVEVCVKKPSSSCAAFDAAQPTSDNPCRFGNRFSATCSQIEARTTPTVRCACS